ncbi:nickel-dependent hydrogenase large subunit [Vibrio hepatarius]|uniref:nickel-dependent hydrogenase large subunit n=1 Tax=Vibrio hepatarius TaxID=171383 RepID=UPI00142DF11D|nr:nickel-dependent hydrogenase large subunit [Vibrio hepatarius]NIY84753.1 nickel-dependent hydrogenase large subunit [Vibrio hepatarius]
MVRRTLNIDLNRVEGDLELELDIEDNVVVDARCVGVMYRGFEQIMIGRTPRDAAVITPRVCGICSTAHLYAATLALEQIWQTPVPDNAMRIRSLCLLTESVQNDIRQSFLMFLVDFCHPSYQKHALYADVMSKFEPFKGRHHLEALAHSRDIISVVALFGGQWPHSSYILPGGVVSKPTIRKLIEAKDTVSNLIRWYEHSVTGLPLDRWLTLTHRKELFELLGGHDVFRHSSVGLFTRFARELNLHQLGVGVENMLSYGAISDADSPQNMVFQSGYYRATDGEVHNFDQSLINEHVRHSWFKPYKNGKHPSIGETLPDFQPDSDRYTWAKAPRYGNDVVQTGPMAELLIGGDELIQSLFREEGASTWLRQFSRLRRIGFSLYQMLRLIDALIDNATDEHFIPPDPRSEIDGQGFGLVQAARGGLGHWVSIKDGVVNRYQIITPTAWNASPKDAQGQHGHWEQSLLGLPVEDDTKAPLLIGHIIRSHDPCLVCTVHMLPDRRKIHFGL